MIYIQCLVQCLAYSGSIPLREVVTGKTKAVENMLQFLSSKLTYFLFGWKILSGGVCSCSVYPKITR